MKLINFIQKLIPAYIEIRSLYWIKFSKQMNGKLKEIFEKIDSDKYEEAKILIENFHSNYNQSSAPRWVAEEMASIYKAESMLFFLTNK